MDAALWEAGLVTGEKTIVTGPKEKRHKIIGGHSYRIGGVVALMEAGCPVLTLQGMGRWVSEAYKLYLRVGTRVLHSWQRAIGRENPNNQEQGKPGECPGPPTKK